MLIKFCYVNLCYLIVGFIGIIKIRDLPSGKCVKEFGCINVVDQGELSEGATPPGYTQLFYHNQLDSIIAVAVDHNIIIYGLPELETKKQVSLIRYLNVVYRNGSFFMALIFHE